MLSSLRSCVKVVTGKMVDIIRARVSGGRTVPYDHLILCAGQQYQAKETKHWWFHIFSTLATYSKSVEVSLDLLLKCKGNQSNKNTTFPSSKCNEISLYSYFSSDSISLLIQQHAHFCYLLFCDHSALYDIDKQDYYVRFGILILV